MEKCIVICPYFGRLPKYFRLWLESCKQNDFITFEIITDDDTHYDTPSNVHIRIESFENFVDQMQNVFDFPICVGTPYKLCDYKPAYGYIFSDLIEEYDFWGYCDFDLILGDLRRFIDFRYDKINYLSHFCLIKNTPELRSAFMTEDEISYKEIFSTNIHMVFDEEGEYGFNRILEKKGYKIMHLEYVAADVSCYFSNLVVRDHRYSRRKYDMSRKVASFENGKVFLCKVSGGIVDKKEYPYIHLQKRHIDCEGDFDSKAFLILPNRMVSFCVIDKNYVLSSQKTGIFSRELFSILLNSQIEKAKRASYLAKVTRNRN